MLNPKLLRYDTKFVAKSLSRRGFILDVKKFTDMEKKRKYLQTKVEFLQSRRNKLSKNIGNKIHSCQDFSHLKNEVKQLIKKLDCTKQKLDKLLKEIYVFSTNIPNLPDSNIPDGLKENYNKEISYWGKIKNFNFKIKDHVDLGNNLNGFNWKSSAKISGSRFIVMQGKIAFLYRILGQFMLDVHTKKHGYLETYVPYLVNKNSLYGTGQLPKFHMDLFYTKPLLDESKNSNEFALIPTAEVPLTNLFRDCMLEEHQLPIMLVANTPCFRSETLSYGRDTRGLIRTHQFDKVEIVQFVHPNTSMKKLDELTYHAETILRLLELPYRKMLLCSGEISFSSTKTYDLEVWFPFQKIYREVSSCSNMLDFQARRIQARFFCKLKNKKTFIHTINGSGLAIGRTLAAILENYQQCDGRIKIPKILKKYYIDGLDYLE